MHSSKDLSGRPDSPLPAPLSALRRLPGLGRTLPRGGRVDARGTDESRGLHPKGWVVPLLKKWLVHGPSLPGIQQPV